MSNDRFNAPRPNFIRPSNPVVVTDGSTGKRNNEPGKTIYPPLPPLNLPTFGNKKKSAAAAKPIKEKREAAPQMKPILCHYGPEDVVSDEEYIRRTRGFANCNRREVTVHDPAMMRLFFANGGAEIVNDYDTLTTAFEALRRKKLAKVSGLKAEEYKRFKPRDYSEKVYVPGTYAGSQMVRDRAKELASRRNENDLWMRSASVAMMSKAG